MKIFVVGSSKNTFFPIDNIREKFLVDNKHDGDNIDNLNPWYCELTGLYYLWKHVDDDIVGLEHYRRYFSINNKILKESDINKLLLNNDIICHTFNCYPANAFIQFLSNPVCTQTAMFSFIYAIELYCGKELADYFLNYLKNNYIVQCNMFIAKKDIIKNYCELFFRLVNNFTMCDKNKRIIGFLSEYFFGAYLAYNNIKTVSVDITKI